MSRSFRRLLNRQPRPPFAVPGSRSRPPFARPPFAVPGSRWLLKTTNQPGTPDFPPFRYGAPSWTPLTGDWDGNGTFAVGVVDSFGQFGRPPVPRPLRRRARMGPPRADI